MPTVSVNPVLASAAGAGGLTNPTRSVYTELRIHTLLLTRIAQLLAQLVGPQAPNSYGTVVAFTPEDLSVDVDSWRNDPNFA